MIHNSPSALGRRFFNMHDMQKVAVDVTFTQMAANKGIRNHGYRAMEGKYKEHTTKLNEVK